MRREREESGGGFTRIPSRQGQNDDATRNRLRPGKVPDSFPVGAGRCGGVERTRDTEKERKRRVSQEKA